MERLELLKQVMALDFCLLDLNLYLDTHPDDTKIIQKYREILHNYETVRKEFVTKYGPLDYTDVAENAKNWQWINEPWPWQIGE